MNARKRIYKKYPLCIKYNAIRILDAELGITRVMFLDEIIMEYKYHLGCRQHRWKTSNYLFHDWPRSFNIIEQYLRIVEVIKKLPWPIAEATFEHYSIDVPSTPPHVFWEEFQAYYNCKYPWHVACGLGMRVKIKGGGTWRDLPRYAHVFSCVDTNYCFDQDDIDYLAAKFFYSERGERFISRLIYT